MGHTPGPWEWSIQDVSMAILCQSGDVLSGHVLALTPCESCADRAKAQGKGWAWGRCTTAREANARLIAAAPELLAALEAIDLARTTDEPRHWQRATELSDVALKKARGEAQDNGSL